MIKFGKIQDQSTGTPIPYASVEITDRYGTYLGAGASADVSGNFNIDSLQIKPGTFARISSVGYKTTSYSYDQFLELQIFSLVRQSQELEEAVVTYDKKKAQQEKMMMFAGLGLLAFLLFTSNKKF
jgi:hypothetical protein